MAPNDVDSPRKLGQKWRAADPLELLAPFPEVMSRIQFTKRSVETEPWSTWVERCADS